LLGVQITEGTVHNVHEAEARQAGVINSGIALSGVRVGLHDEIFQGPRPVLAGVDAKSTFCYLLAAETHRDGDTWGVHLMDAKAQGLNPDYTIADAGQGARVGQQIALSGTPCHGDVFHIRAITPGVPPASQVQQLPGVLETLEPAALQADGQVPSRVRCRGLRDGEHAQVQFAGGEFELAVADQLHAAVQARTPRHEALSLPGRLPGQRQGVLDGVLRDHHRAHRHS